MSRLIVKNLPTKVDAEKLRRKFSEKGDVTDVQLRFTPEGKFRKFAFIGYKTEDQANAALNHFNNSFFNTAKITVQLCADLGSSDKPRPWSKHSKISSDEQQINPVVKDRGKKKKVPEIDEELLEKVEKHRDEPEFREFLEAHGDIVEKVLSLRKEKEEESEVEEEKEKDEETELSCAHAAISDMEYLQLKKKGSNVETPVIIPSTENESKKQTNLYTIKIKNLGKGVKKHDIKQLFKPMVPASIRRARGLLGVAYVGFKTEKEVKKALIKNKTFLKGKQVCVSECKQTQETKEEVSGKWKQQEEGLKGEETIGESGRIFIRNLCYSVTEDELETLFSKYGPLSEVTLPLDKLTRKGKGYGIVTFVFPENAVASYSELDGKVFQGRMLHLLPAKAKEEENIPESNNYKQMKLAKLKKSAGLSHNWNTLFLGRNAVADVIAETYKASKQDVLTGKEAAVRLALGETQLVSSTRQFLVQNGIHLDAFNQQVDKRSKNIILVKNLPANTTAEEIKSKFEKFGVLGRVVLPPSGIMAVVEFEHPTEAKAAFTKTAYTKFKNLPLYLEWAPQNIFVPAKEVKEESTSEPTSEAKDQEVNQINSPESSDDENDPEPDTTLYVKNLNFETSENNLKDHFAPCGKLASVSVSKKKDPKNPGKMLSLGYGFVQFYLRSSLNKALAELQGSILGGHTLELKRSDRTVKPTAFIQRKTTNLKKQTGAKILVRNIPFQANIHEVKQLFGTFGEIKSVRLPKKLVGTGKHRGFGFIEFTTRHEAKAAMKSLSQSTHLYGRRLVLEWAAPDEDEVENIRKRTADHFHSGETESGNKRRAVTDMEVGAESEDEV